MRGPRHRALRTHCAGMAVASMTIALLACGPAQSETADPNLFRVCADPNNLPFSNRAEAGFENKLAELIAGKLGKRVAYTWWAQRRGFIRNTLKAGTCDVVMGVPTKLDMVETTRAYYRSTYVFVSRSDRSYALTSIKDARLRHLSIGVQLIGDDGFNTPPAHALSQEGIVDNLVGFTVYGDYREPNPPARIVDAVASGAIDVAAVWGPLAGYFAREATVPLTLNAITDVDDFKPLAFEFDIGVGVRKGDHALKSQIDDVITAHATDITGLLEQYGVPIVARDTARGESKQR
jgi:mxaJ protein